MNLTEFSLCRVSRQTQLLRAANLKPSTTEFLKTCPVPLLENSKDKFMSETGHAKNMANFATTNIILTGLSAVYNLNLSLILLIPVLQTKLTAYKKKAGKF